MTESVVDAYPLAALQAGMLYHAEYREGTAAYNDVLTLTLAGRFDRSALSDTLADLVERHAVLRTSFDLTGFSEPVQLVHATAVVPLEVLNGDVLAWREREQFRPHDLGAAPLFRATVHVLSDNEFSLSLSFHHAILDGWSLASLVAELIRRYAARLDGEVLPVVAPVDTFRDFVAAERAAIADPQVQDYWRGVLDGVPLSQVPSLPGYPTDGPLVSDRHVIEFSPDLQASIAAAAAELRTPARTLLLAVHLRVLGLLTGSPEVVTGMVTHGRPETEGGAEVAGLFLNTVPLRVRVDQPSWATLVSEVDSAMVDLVPHRRLPLFEIQRLATRSPVFDTAFDYHDFHVSSAPSTSSVRVLRQAHSETTDIPFTAIFARGGGEAGLTLSYHRTRFPASQIEAIGEYYLAAIAELAADTRSDPRRTGPLVRRDLPSIAAWNGTAVDAPAAVTLHGLVAHWAALTPDADAVIDGAQRLTFDELWRRVAALAERLVSIGVDREVVVAVGIARSADALVAILATLQAGGAVLPLDMDHPPLRLRDLMADAGARVLLTATSAATAAVDPLPLLAALTAASSGAPMSAVTGSAAAPLAPASAAGVLLDSSGSVVAGPVSAAGDSIGSPLPAAGGHGWDAVGALGSAVVGGAAEAVPAAGGSLSGSVGLPALASGVSRSASTASELSVWSSSAADALPVPVPADPSPLPADLPAPLADLGTFPDGGLSRVEASPVPATEVIHMSIFGALSQDPLSVEPGRLAPGSPPGEGGGRAGVGGRARGGGGRAAGGVVGDVGGVRAALGGDVAAVLFTSGSTGRPKGVLLTHQGVTQFCAWHGKYMGLTGADRVAQRSPLSVDGTFIELAMALGVGAAVVVVPTEAVIDPEAFEGAFKDITATYLVPSLLAPLVAAGAVGRTGLKHVVSGGELLARAVVEGFGSQTTATLHNIYGPTELGMAASQWVTDPGNPDGPVPIGGPGPGTELHILDDKGEVAPIGTPGEVYAGGPQIARGYLGNPGLTADRFVPSPYGPPGARLYRTGDRARWLPGGVLEFAGRRDNQVKINGIRAELGEIEVRLAEHPRVLQAAVVLPPGRGLTAYVVWAGEQEGAVADIRAFCGERLPAALVPGRYEFLDEIPVLANGKADRAALPEVTGGGADFQPPRDFVESRLEALWEEVLELPAISIRDDFFALGGHSLRALRLVMRLRKDFGREVPIETLMTHPTIEQLAVLLRAPGQMAPTTPVVPLRKQGGDPPVWFVHALGGQVFRYRKLAGLLGDDQPSYGIPARGFAAEDLPLESVAAMVDEYVERILATTPDQPVVLAGFCVGGNLALEVARELRARGVTVPLVAVFWSQAVDSVSPHLADDTSLMLSALAGAPIGIDHETLAALPPRERLAAIVEGAAAAGALDPAVTDLDQAERMLRVFRANANALRGYRHAPYDGDFVLLKPEQDGDNAQGRAHGWDEVITGELDVVAVPGSRYDTAEEPHVRGTAMAFREVLDRVHSGR